MTDLIKFFKITAILLFLLFTPNLKKPRKGGVDSLVGLQWGDEGKGKDIDILSPLYDIVARFQGGPNAGHTLIVNGIKIVLHSLPSGVFYSHIKNFIGPGCVVDAVELMNDIRQVMDAGIDLRGRLFISEKAKFIFPIHKKRDEFSEMMKGDKKVGTTGRGIKDAYVDFYGRDGLIVEDYFKGDFSEKLLELTRADQKYLSFYNFCVLNEGIDEANTKWVEAFDYCLDFMSVVDEFWLNDKLDSGARVLAEGAQGTWLDISIGDRPNVTSSYTTTAGVPAGLGIPPSVKYMKTSRVYGVIKAYATRVGNGKFKGEIFGEEANALRQIGGEFGATTGRPRRPGWLELKLLRDAIRLNGVTHLFINKIDPLFSRDCNVLIGNRVFGFSGMGLVNGKPNYEMRKFMFLIQSFLVLNCLRVKIVCFGIGPERKDSIFLNFWYYLRFIFNFIFDRFKINKLI